MAWMQISTELTITLTSYLPRTLVVTSQTAFIVIILVMKLQRTVSQFMWERLASLSWGTFASLRTRSYQFLNVARSNGLICIIIFDWMFLLHVSMHHEQGLFTTNLSWGLLGLVRLIKICKKLNTGALSIQGKLSKIWKQRQIVRKSIQKSRKLLNFRNVNHSIENSKKNPRAKLNGKNTSGKKKIENLGIPRVVVLFFGNFGNRCSIRYRKLPKTQTGRFGWMEIKRPRSLDSELFVMQKKSCYIWLWKKNLQLLRSDHVTRKALTARNGMRPRDQARST